MNNNFNFSSSDKNLDGLLFWVWQPLDTKCFIYCFEYLLILYFHFNSSQVVLILILVLIIEVVYWN